MAVTKRIIPCLDVNNGRVVKGISFVNLRDAGDPVETAFHYYKEGADEIAFLDISATHTQRNTVLEMVERVAEKIFIPLTVGGGVRTVEDIRNLHISGADKIAINSAAIHDPSLITRATDRVGNQCIVIAIDAKKTPDGKSWEVFTHGGRKPTGIDVIRWAKQTSASGAGEILLTSMDNDGQQKGFDVELTRRISEQTQVPIIASGGVGNTQHMIEGITLGKADAVLAASIFHFGILSIAQVKHAMHKAGILVRL